MALQVEGIKYPAVEVNLPYGDNAFALLGVVQRGMKDAGISKDECNAFFAEATAGDYDELTATCERWVTCL
jgi:hypothetical protein